MSTSQHSATDVAVAHKDVPTRTADVGGTPFAYRLLGPPTGVPLILLNHLSAVLDNWDPRVVDGLAAERRVVTFDNRGVGASGGITPRSIAAMARDTALFIRAMGYTQVDLLGFSLGGFVTQSLVQQEPHLIRKIIVAGTGPAGGVGIDKVTAVTLVDMLRAALTLRDPKYYLFFTTTPNGRRAARDLLNRLKERTNSRDRSISLSAFRNQLKAIHRWGREAPADLSAIRHPVLVVNGDNDRMVPTSNSRDLARRLPMPSSFCTTTRDTAESSSTTTPL